MPRTLEPVSFDSVLRNYDTCSGTDPRCLAVPLLVYGIGKSSNNCVFRFSPRVPTESHFSKDRPTNNE
jgi:hypothetical protein